ncbi:MAG: hypothetical protein ACFFDT_25595, partial [Candidatus Hodarchaeota archaeon]
WGEDYIIGAEISGIFLFELSTGIVVNSNSEVISFISYRFGNPEAPLLFFGVIIYLLPFIFVIIVIIMFWRRKKRI